MYSTRVRYITTWREKTFRHFATQCHWHTPQQRFNIQHLKTLLQLRIAQKTSHNKHHLNPMNYSGFHRGRMRFSLVLNVTRCRLVVSYRCFGTAYWSHLQGPSSPRRLGFLDYKGDDPSELRWIVLCLISSMTFSLDFILTESVPSHLVLNMQLLLVWERLFVESQNATQDTMFTKHCCIQGVTGGMCQTSGGCSLC